MAVGEVGSTSAATGEMAPEQTRWSMAGVLWSPVPSSRRWREVHVCSHTHTHTQVHTPTHHLCKHMHTHHTPVHRACISMHTPTQHVCKRMCTCLHITHIHTHLHIIRAHMHTPHLYTMHAHACTYMCKHTCVHTHHTSHMHIYTHTSHGVHADMRRGNFSTNSRVNLSGFPRTGFSSLKGKLRSQLSM